MKDDYYTVANWDAIPEHMHGAVFRYVMSGIDPGSFLRAVLENDFVRAVGSADHINSKFLKEWAAFLYNDVPHNCWGSADAVDSWIARGGFDKIMGAQS